MLILAIFSEDLADDYFMVLRFACFTAFSFWAWALHEKAEIKWRNTFIVTALLYNPFLLVRLEEEEIWIAANIIALLFVVKIWRIMKCSKTAQGERI